MGLADSWREGAVLGLPDSQITELGLADSWIIEKAVFGSGDSWWHEGVFGLAEPRDTDAVFGLAEYV